MTETVPFQLKADFSPAGDQPQAIAKLVEGLKSGLSHQTLLGVTGSGKSIGYDDPIVVQENLAGVNRTMVVQAGPFIDSLVEANNLGTKTADDTEQYACVDQKYFTQAYNPYRGSSGWHPVGAFLRHRAPADMFRVTTKCGRAVTLTGDHNLWVLRDGAPALIKTEEVRATDHLPAPEKVSEAENLRTLDILPYLADSNLSVFAEAEVLQFVAAGGRAEFVDAIGACGIRPEGKLRAIRHGIHGSGLKVPHFLRLASATNQLGGGYLSPAIRVGGKSAACRLPAKLPLSDSVLRLFGYYVAEGNGQRGYVIIANRHPVLRSQIEQALSELGIAFGVRPSSDYQVSSTALARLLGKLCGKTAAYKRLPEFWPRLSDRSLGILLRAYFDGDGTVGSCGEVSATTASEALASDLAYALKRFGIHARLRRQFKRATNSNHAGAWYSYVVVSSRDDVQRFADNVGFNHPDKHARMHEILKRGADTNTDAVPICGASLRDLRRAVSLTMLKLAGLARCSRSMISLIESTDRQPSRSLLVRILGALAGEARRNEFCNFAWWKQWRALDRLCAMRWMPIKKFERIQYNHPFVYDLSVPGPETFLAGTGGVFVHNTYSIANVVEQLQRPTIVLAHNKTLAAQLYGEFRDFFPNNSVEYFVSYYDYYQPEAYVPASDTYIEKDASINQHIEQMRLSATKALLERPDSIIVATVSAIYGLGDPKAYLAMVMHLVRGERMDQRKLLRRLADMQYTRNEMDLEQATYRVRGDVIDIFPAEADREAIRVELDDDEIKTLTLFDPLTGETTRKVPRFTVYPATHYVTPKDRLLNVLDQIREDLISRLKELRDNNKLVEAQRLEQRTLFDIEMMNEVGYCSGIENYSRYLSGRAPGEPPPCLFDYLPKNALLIVDESHQTIPQLGGMYRGDRSRKETLVEYGFRLPSALDNRPLRFDEFESLAPQMIFVSATPGPYEAQHSGQVVEQVVRPTGLIDPEVEVRPVRSQVEDVLSEIKRCADANQRVLITTLTKRMAEDLTEYLHEHGVRVRYLHSDVETVERVEIIRDLRLGKFDVLVGINLLREGLDMPEVALVAILDADKEGFLRSDNSLIQTIGRAARNIDGRAILYADKVTGSMRRAIDETNRRRAKQIEFNTLHNITPRGIIKGVSDVMEGARSNAENARIAAELSPEFGNLPPEQLLKRIKKLEQEMFRLARNLEFEEAAKLRDQIGRMRKAGLGLGNQLAS